MSNLTPEEFAVIKRLADANRKGGMCKADLRTADGPTLKAGPATLPTRKPRIAVDNAYLWPEAVRMVGKLGACWCGSGDTKSGFHLLTDAGPVVWLRDVEFHPVRRWAIDWANAHLRIGVEVDGGQYKHGGGRHGGDADREKTNEAIAMGWRILHFSPRQLKRDPAGCVAVVLRALAALDSVPRIG